ncbi:MAG: low molecular weight protein arginine phosphatase [Longimicrobiales bacterium]
MGERAPFNVLFVCTGNTCRSPMAAVVARRALQERGWDHVSVRSAGTSAYRGGGASVGALRATAAAGLDLENHVSRPLSVDMVEWADLILPMAPSHMLDVSDFGGAEKAAPLASFAPDAEDGDVPAVPDPFGGSDEEYARTFESITAMVEEMLTRLETEIAQ